VRSETGQDIASISRVITEPGRSRRGESKEDTYIFDWQSCMVGPPAHDLAYMLPRHWHPEPRRDLFDRLLETYHASLVRGGVTSCPRDRAWEDFLVGVLRQAVTPATNWFRWGRSGSHAQGPSEWAERLERILVPFDALCWQDTLASFHHSR
jgi:thiamine kinase-like enzyme